MHIAKRFYIPVCFEILPCMLCFDSPCHKRFFYIDQTVLNDQCHIYRVVVGLLFSFKLITYLNRRYFAQIETNFSGVREVTSGCLRFEVGSCRHMKLSIMSS